MKWGAADVDPDVGLPPDQARVSPTYDFASSEVWSTLGPKRLLVESQAMDGRSGV